MPGSRRRRRLLRLRRRQHHRDPARRAGACRGPERDAATGVPAPHRGRAGRRSSRCATTPGATTVGRRPVRSSNCPPPTRWPTPPTSAGLGRCRRASSSSSLVDGDGPDVYVDPAGPAPRRCGADAIDASALRAAAQDLLHAHPPLRAWFRQLPDGRLVQVVAARVTLPWQEVDLSGLAAARRQSASTSCWPPTAPAASTSPGRRCCGCALVRLGDGAARLRADVPSHRRSTAGRWRCCSASCSSATAPDGHRGAPGRGRSTGRRRPAPRLSVARRPRDAARAAWRAALAGLDGPDTPG